MATATPTPAPPGPVDLLREDLFLRDGARSLAPLAPALAACRAFRDDLLERLTAPASQALLLPFAVPAAPAGAPAGSDLPLLLLRRAPANAARLCPVVWPTGAFPKNPAVLSEALAHAIGASPAELPTVLQRLLQQRPLILLHPALRSHYDRDEGEDEGGGLLDDDAALRYYTAWLPELLGRIRAQHPLHALQPIEWPALSPLRQVAARALAALWPSPPRAARRVLAARDALVLMERLLDPLRQRRVLPIRALPILTVPRLRESDLPVNTAGGAEAAS